MEAQIHVNDGLKEQEVIKAWYLNKDTDQEETLPCHCQPKEFVSFNKLIELGIHCWCLNNDDYENDKDLKRIREARSYSHTYTFDVHPERMIDFEAKVKSFFVEHLHPNEETTYCLEGSGYYDVRDENDRWIRLAIKKGGGLILLPAGIYHRFALDAGKYIKAVLFFVGRPVDLTYKRPSDDLPARKEYMKTFIKKEIESQRGELSSIVS